MRDLITRDVTEEILGKMKIARSCSQLETVLVSIYLSSGKLQAKLYLSLLSIDSLVDSLKRMHARTRTGVYRIVHSFSPEFCFRVLWGKIRNRIIELS